MCHRKARAIEWGDCAKDGRVRDNLYQPGRCDGDEPQYSDGPEEATYQASSASLDSKEQHQNAKRNRHNVGFGCGRQDFQALDCRKHRNRRRDNSITEKQGHAKDPDHQEHAAQLRLVFDRLRGQRQQRHQPALAVIVGAHDQHHVFERYDDGKRPEKHRQRAQHALFGNGDMARRENLFEGIEGRSADVAINDTDGAQRKGRKR